MIECRHIQYECIDGQYRKIQSEKVMFVNVVGELSALVVDKNGKQKRVRRKNLLDVPDYLLYPEHKEKHVEHADWRTYTHFD